MEDEEALLVVTEKNPLSSNARRMNFNFVCQDGMLGAFALKELNNTAQGKALAPPWELEASAHCTPCKGTTKSGPLVAPLQGVPVVVGVTQGGASACPGLGCWALSGHPKK